MVGKIKVIFKHDVTQFLSDLTQTLYKKNYFSYLESVYEYVDFIYDEIETTIHLKKHYLSPENLAVYGKYYIYIKTTKRTAWYVFFDKKDNRYIVRYITNNHVSDAAFLKDL